MGLAQVVDNSTENSRSNNLPDVETDKKSIAAYIRVSTERQAENDSHVRQRETVENWVEENVSGEYKIYFFEDIAESGQNISRDEYKQLMEDIEYFDIVVVRELSRFGRSLQKILQDIEKMEQNDCNFISIKDDQINTDSAQGQLLFNIIASFNQFWADLARERTQEMIQRRKEEGKPIGRPKKLTSQQLLDLWEMRQESNHSYTTLAAIAETKGYVDSINRSTIHKWISKLEDGELTEEEVKNGEY